MKLLKVALVHDDLVQWGGAERVLVGLSEIFPDAPIYTSLYDRSNPLIFENFKNKDIRTSFLQKIPFWKNLYEQSSITKWLYKAFLPLYPIAFEQFDFSEYDLVITQTTRFAKAIITKPGTIHICYCHTPPRFLWNFSDERNSKIITPLFSKLRFIDQIIASRVDYWLAGSENARLRIKKIYKKDSRVLYPFVKKINKIADKRGNDYYLVISRLNKYKRVDVVVDAFNSLTERLVIVGKGPQKDLLMSRAKNNIKFYEDLDEGALDRLIQNCKALIVVAEEDFGLTSLEAQAFGKPILAYGIGGSFETVKDGVTGVLFNEQTKEALFESLSTLNKLKIKPNDCIENAQKFSFSCFKEGLNGFINSAIK